MLAGNAFADDYYSTGQGSSWVYDVTRSNGDGTGAWTRPENAYISGFETVRYPDGRNYTGFKFWWHNDDSRGDRYDVGSGATESIKWVDESGTFDLFGTSASAQPNQPLVWVPSTFDIGT